MGNANSVWRETCLPRIESLQIEPTPYLLCQSLLKKGRLAGDFKNPTVAHLCGGAAFPGQGNAALRTPEASCRSKGGLVRRPPTLAVPWSRCHEDR